MKELTFEIKPLKGLSTLEFGVAPLEVNKFLGQPSEEETFEDDEMGDTLVCHFWDHSVSAFYDDPKVKPALSNLETDNTNALMFGKRVFDLRETEVIKLMNDNGFKEIDTEMMEDEELGNEKRVSFDDAIVDFYFEDDMLSAISWGMFLDFEEEGED